jgi:hypothetical protein
VLTGIFAEKEVRSGTFPSDGCFVFRHERQLVKCELAS